MTEKLLNTCKSSSNGASVRNPVPEKWVRDAKYPIPRSFDRTSMSLGAETPARLDKS